MRCPFPGMDPYLEQSGIWPRFHLLLLGAIQNQLTSIAPDNYDIGADEEVRVIAPDRREPPRIVPDVAVMRDPAARLRRPIARSGGTALLEPTMVAMVDSAWDEVRHAWLEVRRLPDNELVTVIAVLSPWNKRDLGFGALLSKRRATLRRGVHWVEIDLLVGGQRTPLDQPRPPGNFNVLVVRSEDPRNAEVYSWGLRDRLPTVPIPLRAPDPDLPLDLAQAFSETYENSRMDKALRRLYGQPPETEFADADRQWAAGLAQ